MTGARKPRAQRLSVLNGIVLLVVLINILQLWLFTMTVNASLGADTSTIVPAGIASLVCLGLNLGLLRYMRRLDV